jgi:ZIP family zinc transporter
MVLETLFANYPIWFLGVMFSLGAGLCTGLGALPVFFTRKITPKSQDIFLSFGAGIMLAATSFSLIVPGLEAAGGGVYAASIVVIGILLGGLFLWLADKYIPHEHFIKGKEGPNVAKLKKLWLFIIAITLHNLPEGLSVGIGFGTGDIGSAISLAIGMGIQNMPEGLVVALALVSHKYSVKKSIFIATLTGLVEPIGGILGAGVVSIFTPILPLGLAFAAGAMLFIISDEIIPETHRKGYAKLATLGLMIGFVVMLFLDVTLG